jgi:hypothetical protein
MNRRDFMTQAGMLGMTGLAILAGCAGAQKTLKDPSAFDMNAFVSWYKRNKLYARLNPNFRGPGYQWHTFQRSIIDGWTPGIDWKVASGTPVIACPPSLLGK